MEENNSTLFYGSWGWAEFDSNRTEILNDYELAKTRDSSRPVRTNHGNILESSILKWFNTYLPSKYAATSGYIAPNNYDLDYQILHYDVIIYLRNEAPILWVEADKDEIKTRAIPAEYVVAVIEVKSTFTHTSIKEAIVKLHELDVYKNDLHKHFFTSIIFAELLEKDTNKTKMIYDLFEANNLNNFWKGLILKNNIEDNIPCLFTFTPCENDVDIITDSLVKKISSLDIYLDKVGNLKIAGNGAGASLTKIKDKSWAVNKEFQVLYARNKCLLTYIWSRKQFLVFSIELINRLNGNNTIDSENPRYGRVFDSLEVRNT